MAVLRGALRGLPVAAATVWLVFGSSATLAGASVAKVAGVTKEARHRRISPELEPTSDKKFFGKDYPTDLQPRLKVPFDHPYPTVQDSEDWDIDFVKDENGDGGRWAAQMEYDTLRNKVAQRKEAVDRAESGEDSAKDRYEKAKAKHKKAEEASEEAEKRVKEAREKAEGIDEELDAENGGNETGAEGKNVSGATDDVMTRAEKLKKCEEELAKARAELERLAKDKEARQKELDAQRAAAGKNLTDAEAAEKIAEGEQAEQEKKAKALRDKMAQEEREHEEALKSLHEEEEDVTQVEGEMKKAEEKLKSLRSKAADSHGGVHSSASMAEASPLAVVLALAVAVVRMC